MTGKRAFLMQQELPTAVRIRQDAPPPPELG